MQITFTIPDNKASEFKIAFLQIYPVPIEDGVPIMTENKWIKSCIRKLIYSVYEQGTEQIFHKQNEPTFDENIIEV